MEDVRLIWMKEVIYRFLILDVTSQAFEDLLKRDTANSDTFQKFFSNSDDSPRCLFFYSDIVEEEIEKDDPVELPVEKEKADTSFSSGSIKSESDAASESIIADADEISKGFETDEDDTQKELADDAEKRSGAEKLSRTSLVLIVKKTELYVLESITEYVTSRSYAYFLLRARDRPVPRVKNMYEARQVLPGHFDVGRIGQHPLVCIDKMVSCLYLPLLENETAEPQLSEKHYPIDKKKISTLMSGLTREMRDFTESTKHVLEQLNRPDASPLPTFLDQPFDDLEEACKDSEFIAEAHDVARQWTDIAGQWAELCEEVSEQKPPENGLINEIDFWKKQKLRLSACLDQLSHTTIQETLEVFDKIGCDISELKSITHQVEMELTKVTENVNYLSLLEKNAKNLLPGSPVQEAKKSLYDIFTVLKVMWVQSEHFKEPENLGRVLRGVTTLLKNRVVTDARNDMLFRKPLVEVRNIVDHSIEILEYWKKLYFSECETVKKYGGPYWWRFDARMLFAETDYIITVCEDLRKVTKALQELHNIFNTSLRFFVEDQERLSTMENRIFGVTALIQYSEFDIFDRESKPDWDRIVFVFMRDVSTFEDELKDYLGSLFKESLSWDNAYILARSFDEEDVSPSIKEFIDNSRTDMLRQFVTEISITENKFLAHENNPPLLEGIPAATSSILWGKNLLLDISRPLAKIFENDTMSKKDLEVQERFKKTEQLLLSYQNAKYDFWKVEAAEKLNQFLQTSVLKKQPISTDNLIGIS